MAYITRIEDGNQSTRPQVVGSDAMLGNVQSEDLEITKLRTYEYIVIALGQGLNPKQIRGQTKTGLGKIRTLYKEADVWARSKFSIPFRELPIDFDFGAVANEVAAMMVEREKGLLKASSATMTRLNWDTKFAEERDARLRRRHKDPGFAKVRDENCARLNDPAIQEKAAEACRARWVIAARSETMTRLHLDPEFARVRDENVARLNAGLEIRAKALATRLKNGKHRLPQAKREEVIAALNEGLTTQEIRVKTGVGRSNIQSIAKDIGRTIARRSPSRKSKPPIAPSLSEPQQVVGQTKPSCVPSDAAIPA